MATDDIINKYLGVKRDSKSTLLDVVRKDDKDTDVDNMIILEKYYDLIQKGQGNRWHTWRRKRRRTSRAYEVALNGIKQVSDTVDKLQDSKPRIKRFEELHKHKNTEIQDIYL